jgi:hypothetical protein
MEASANSAAATAIFFMVCSSSFRVPGSAVRVQVPVVLVDLRGPVDLFVMSTCMLNAKRYDA